MRPHLSIHGSILWFSGKWWRRLINSPVDTKWKDKIYSAAETLGLLPHMAFTGCAAGQGMVFDFSVQNREYNFVRVCPNYKQGIFASTIDLISEMKFVCSPNIYKRYGFKIRQRMYFRIFFSLTGSGFQTLSGSPIPKYWSSTSPHPRAPRVHRMHLQSF